LTPPAYQAGKGPVRSRRGLYQVTVRTETIARGVSGRSKTRVSRFVPFVCVGWHGKNIHVGHSCGGQMPSARSATKRPHPITLAHGSDSNIDRSQRCLASETRRSWTSVHSAQLANRVRTVASICPPLRKAVTCQPAPPRTVTFPPLPPAPHMALSGPPPWQVC
jgi:hypothetical protein